MATFQLLNDYDGTFVINENNEIVTANLLDAMDYTLTVSFTDGDTVLEEDLVLSVTSANSRYLTLGSEQLTLGDDYLTISNSEE